MTLTEQIDRMHRENEERMADARKRIEQWYAKVVAEAVRIVKAKQEGRVEP